MARLVLTDFTKPSREQLRQIEITRGVNVHKPIIYHGIIYKKCFDIRYIHWSRRRSLTLFLHFKSLSMLIGITLQLMWDDIPQKVTGAHRSAATILDKFWRSRNIVPTICRIRCQIEVHCRNAHCAHCYLHGLTLITVCITNCVHYKVCDEITYPNPNVNGCAVEVWEWISNVIPHFTGCIITYPWRD